VSVAADPPAGTEGRRRVRAAPVGPQGGDSGPPSLFVIPALSSAPTRRRFLFRLVLLFTLLPLAELSLLLRIGEWIGLGPTLGLVIGTGIAGAGLARREGLRTWASVRRELTEGRVPAEGLLHALLILMAGVLLVTPGVITDMVGLTLLVRPARVRLARGMRRHLAHRIDVRVAGLGGPDAAEPPSRTAEQETAGGRGRIIDI